MADGGARNARSAHEERLLATAARLLPSGVRNPVGTPDAAMVVASARGGRLRDTSGNEYVDYLLGSGPMLLGHAHPAVVDAVSRALERGSSYLLVNEPAIELAERLVELVPCAEAVSFHNSGSEAVFYALRLARAWRGRDKILKFEGAYHGMGDAALMSTQWTRPTDGPPRAVPDSAGIPASAADDVLVAPFNDLDAVAAILERHHDELAAVLVEPLQRTLAPQPGFLDGLAGLARRYDLVLVFDEVVTGFRLGLGGAQQRYGVTPDLCALGKSLSCGHPFAALCGRSELMALGRPGRDDGRGVLLTGTYSANPISATAALAALRELERPGVYELPLGVSLDELVRAAGGYVGNLKAFSPGGASSGFLPAKERTRPLDFKSLAEAGSMLGSAGVVVLNESVDMAQAVAWQLEFFERESCGQCAPCRIGTRYIRRQVDRYLSIGDPATLREDDTWRKFIHQCTDDGCVLTPPDGAKIPPPILVPAPPLLLGGGDSVSSATAQA